MRLKLMQLIAIGLLAGCCPKPTIIREPVEVKVPVAVPCGAKQPEKPKWAMDTLTASANIFDKGLAAIKEIEQRRQYERELEATLKACT